MPRGTDRLAASVPVVSSRIAGSIGILGADYAGYFPTGDEHALARLLHRCETEPSFYRALHASCRKLRPLVSPARERRGWSELLREIT